MKALTLIRHAKSSWSDPQLADFDRPLNKRGIRDLQSMALRVRDFGLAPDQLVTSGAKRALETAKVLARELALRPDQVLVQPEFYTAGSQELLCLLRRQNDQWQHLMVVGHNPGLQDLGGYLTSRKLPKFPTAAVVHMHLRIDRWCDLDLAHGTVELLDYPKLHR